MKKNLIVMLMFAGCLYGQIINQPEFVLIDSVKASGAGFWGGSASSNLDLIVYGPYIGSESAITNNDSLFFFSSQGEKLKGVHIGNTVWSIATTPNGEYTVVGTDNEDILVFHNTEKIAQNRIPDNCCQKRGIAVSDDGKYFGVGGAKFTLHSFTNSNLIIPIYTGVDTRQLRAIDFSANNKYVAFGGRFDPQNLTYIAIYDLEAKALVFSDTLEQPTGADGELRQIAISSNGNRVFAGTFGQDKSKIYYYSRDDSTSNHWSLKEEISSPSSIYWVDMDDAGTMAVVGTQADDIQLYSLSDSGIELSWTYPPPMSEFGTDGGERFVSISPNGEYIVATTRGGGQGGGRLLVLDRFGNTIFWYASYAEKVNGGYVHPDSWFGAISDDGNRVTFASNGGYAYFFERDEPPINTPPIVSDIPDQTINQGSSFAIIQLDDFVEDFDNSDSEIAWSFSGNVELGVLIDGSRVATIKVPDSNWSGSETITFTATDPLSASDNNQATFTVTSVNSPPVVNDIPDQTIDEGSSFAIIQLDDFVSDFDNSDSEITWSYSGNAELVVAIDESRVATIATPNQDWFGSEAITFTATDPTNRSDSNQGVFTVNSINDTPVIEGLPSTIVISIDSSAVINLWDYVSDVEDSDSELIYFFITLNENIVISFNSETGELALSTNTNYSGEETLTIRVADSDIAYVESSVSVQVEEVTGISEYLSNEVPDEFELMQNYPNPFNPSTTISFALPQQANVKLTIYNSIGEEIAQLLNNNIPAGYHSVNFEAAHLSSGLYFYRITIIASENLSTKKRGSLNSGFMEVKKMFLLK